MSGIQDTPHGPCEELVAELSAQRHLALQAEASERAIPKILD